MEIKPAHIITVKVADKEKEYHLTEPTWPVYKIALQKYLGGSEGLDYIGSGEIIIDACYLSNQESLDDLKNNYKLFAMLCLRAANLVEFYEADIKKN